MYLSYLSQAEHLKGTIKFALNILLYGIFFLYIYISLWRGTQPLNTNFWIHVCGHRCLQHHIYMVVVSILMVPTFCLTELKSILLFLITFDFQSNTKGNFYWWIIVKVRIWEIKLSYAKITIPYHIIFECTHVYYWVLGLLIFCGTFCFLLYVTWICLYPIFATVLFNYSWLLAFLLFKTWFTEQLNIFKVKLNLFLRHI